MFIFLIFLQSLKTSKRKSLLSRVLVTYLQPPLLLLCVAGGLRQGGGLVWSYNVKAYFAHYYCGSVNVGSYLSWVPLLGGIVGALFGGWVSDKLAKTRGIAARLWVLIVSQLAAIPFLVGALYLPPSPWAFLSLLPAYAIGEMWIGVCLAVVIAMAPRDITSAAVALFLFIINNLGGSMPLLVPPLEMSIGLRSAILVLFPGLYFLAALLFVVTLCVWKCSELVRLRKEREADGCHNEVDEREPLIQNEGMEDILSRSQDASVINSYIIFVATPT